MRRSITTFVALCLFALWAAAPASGAFGLKDLDITFTDLNGETVNQAGTHPFAMKTSLSAETKEEPLLGFPVPDEEVKDLGGSLPIGLAGDPTAVPPCASLDFLTRLPGNLTKCADSAALGFVEVTAGDPNETQVSAVYNLEPPPGVVAKFGFWAIEVVPVTVELRVSPTPPYEAIFEVAGVSQVVPFYASELTVWGNPADAEHDIDRGKCVAPGAALCPAGVAVDPFLTLPRACEGPLASVFEAVSWQGSFFEESILTHDSNGNPFGFIDCAKLDFEPQASAQPSTDQAESPSGLDFELEVEDQGLANPEGTAASDIKKATVTLPEGMTLNPSTAEGLLTCSKAAYEAESLKGGPDGCPDASKVGTVEAETPILEGAILKGQLFVAAQDDPATTQPGAENPFDSLIALYMVIREPKLGLLFKLAGRVTPNPLTGQIETTFGEPGHELPQYPLGHVRIHLREGGRSPLISPPSCGTYAIEALFTSWADPANPLPDASNFEITKGVGGAPCPPAGPRPFAPGFSAGTLNNEAKSYSPFNMRLTRRDGDQDMTKFSAILPPGLIGKIAGIDRCSDAQIAAAKAKTGHAELASPSCPANSQVGRTLAGAGVGSQLTYVPGKLYLAGPYHGAPLSVVAITSAVAGPFDVGTVVVRVALKLNPVTAEVEVDGSRSDPIPHILEGIVLKVRDLRVYVDRPNFILNPTSCAPSQARATLFGSYLDVFNPGDDVPVSLADRFQAANCTSLGFKPKLDIRLKGGTSRGAHPALRAVVTPRPNDANFGRAVVTLPRSAFLDQAHIRTICTRVQFAAEACPKGAIYGHATAWSPLLEEPAKGPVYLRSSNHNLPDLVAALKGPPSAAVDVELVGRIDSHKGGIRSSFESIPDVPVSRFVLEMQGGKKGLIVNSRNLCTRKSRATARLTGQNGRRHNTRPLVRAAGCAKQGAKRRAHRRPR